MKRALLGTMFALAFGFAASNVSAATITLTSSSASLVGTITPSVPANDADELGYLNTLLDLAANASTTIGGQTYVRTSLRTVGFADATGPVTSDGSNSSGQITATGSFSYVYAKYDAGNAGAYVWAVSGNTGDIINVPTVFAGGQYGISQLKLFGPGTSVPDGGTAVGLLGIGLLALALARRQLA